MSERIKRYYHERVKNDVHNNFLWQVGKTINGKAVAEDQVDLIIKTVANKLQLDRKDIVLDVGCGNGLLTKEVSKYVSEIVGLELTPDLYEIAKEYNTAKNISYINCNALNFSASTANEAFTKIYLYEVIQHFNYPDTDALFAKLNEVTATNAAIFIGGILDIEKKWQFFDTMERRCMYFSGLRSGNDSLGTWYHKDYFNCLTKKYNFHVECIAQENNLYTSHYRFDCLLRKK